MNLHTELEMIVTAAAAAGVDVESPTIKKIIDHYADADGGGYPSGTIRRSKLCGAKLGRKTRNKRARQIRRQAVIDLQAAGILPTGSFLWLILTQSGILGFLLQWIMEILTQAEETQSASAENR